MRRKNTPRLWSLVGTTLVVLVLAAFTTNSGATAMSAADGVPVVPGQVIVALVPGASASAVAEDHGAHVLRDIAGGRFFLFSVAPGQERQIVETLRGDRRVRFAEPNWLRQLHDAPDDDGYGYKWDLNNDGTLCDGTDCAAPDADMDWQEAYTLLGSGFSGSAVVAVIDTGIDLNHPDLNDKIVPGYDFLDNDPDPTDTYGHGTHVAGIALAETNNGAEVTEPAGEGDTAGVGYSPNIKVMPLRVCDQNGCPTSAIVDAIYYAADNGANVINLSLGGKIGSASEEQAINYAWDKGLVIVASSGNDGAGRVSYPAAFANVIAVGSTNWRDELAPYSNTGKDLDVVAPGGDMDRYDDPGGIWSTMPTYDVYLTTQYAYDKNYDHLQGTSMAAPQVSGLAALLFAMGVADTNGDGQVNDEVRGIIESTADDLGKAGWDREFGWGRINVYNAVLAAGGGTTGNPPTVSWVNPSDGDTVSGTVTVQISASDTEDADGTLTVEWRVDGGAWQAATYNANTGYYEATWDTTTVADGGHTLDARATDSDGNVATASIAVTTENTDDPPAVNIVSPVDGSTVSGTVTIQVDATDDRDAAGTLTVEVSIDGGAWQLTAYNSTTGYYELNWDTTTVADGSHTIDARATDSAGNTANALQITVTVDNTAPPGDENDMYVWAIDFAQKDYGPGGSLHDLKTTVTLRRDTDADGVAESTDDPVADASVKMTLTHDTDGDGVFECGTDDDCWNFGGTTDSAGQVTFTLKFAPTGAYEALVTDITHSTFTWNPALDADNPDYYTLQ